MLLNQNDIMVCSQEKMSNSQWLLLIESIPKSSYMCKTKRTLVQNRGLGNWDTNKILKNNCEPGPGHPKTSRVQSVK